jgi:hypothetical protein
MRTNFVARVFVEPRRAIADTDIEYSPRPNPIASTWPENSQPRRHSQLLQLIATPAGYVRELPERAGTGAWIMVLARSKGSPNITPMFTRAPNDIACARSQESLRVRLISPSRPAHRRWSHSRRGQVGQADWQPMTRTAKEHRGF